MQLNDQIKVNGTEENPIISLNNDTYFNVSLLRDKFIDEKEMTNFIKSVEKMVRSSKEYTTLIKYIKEGLQLNYCSFLNTLNTDMVSIELHHTPYNLFQIVNTIILKNEIEKIPFNSFSVSLEVIKLHYKNYIGLVGLSKTMHELVHSGEKFNIHRDMVLGNVDSFYNLYKDYMTEELRYIYKSWNKYSEDNPTDALNTLELFDPQLRTQQISETKHYNNKYSIPSSTDNNAIENQAPLPELEL